MSYRHPLVLLHHRHPHHRHPQVLLLRTSRRTRLVWGQLSLVSQDQQHSDESQNYDKVTELCEYLVGS
jgi:hypothetical protein